MKPQEWETGLDRDSHNLEFGKEEENGATLTPDHLHTAGTVHEVE